jgi:hypothetical protein
MSSNNLPKSLLIKIKATHFNYVNKNHVLYTENAVRRGAKSWTTPYNKPQLIGHNTKRDPIGRVVDYKIIKSEAVGGAPGDYVELTAKITDQDSIEKILDGRYATVSVGSSSCRVICSECDQVITEDGLCEHKKGSYNEKGNPIYWIIDQIGYTEDSFVNDPADEYAIIDKVLIAGDWVEFTKFSDSRESYLNEFQLEDSMDNNDAKLSTEQRKKLPDSAFCGPNRSFPAHDKAHVTAGLRLLGRAKASDDTKAKIRACLYRKGKKYGITPQKDEVGEDFDILFRMEDDFTPEEVAELDTWFQDNPDSDLPEVENTDSAEEAEKQEDSAEEKDVTKMKKDELVEEVKRLQKELEDSKAESTKAIDVRDAKITELEDKVRNAETIAYEKEDALNKYVDKTCVLEKKYRDSIISNIIDLKTADNNSEERSEVESKFEARSLDSLEDSLKDLRNEKFETPINAEGRVEDPTKDLNNKDQSSDSQKNTDEADSEETTDPRFKIFSVDRRNMEAE